MTTYTDVPVGTIVFYGSNTIPANWLICDGSQFNETTYPELYTYMGTNWTPDLRGLFIRGMDPEGIWDPDGTTREMWSYQSD